MKVGTLWIIWIILKNIENLDISKVELALLSLAISLVESSSSHSYASFKLGNGPLFETKIRHGSPRGNTPPKYPKYKSEVKTIPLPPTTIKPEYVDDKVPFLPTPTYQNEPTPPLLYLRPTYKPNPEPFVPSPKLYNIKRQWYILILEMLIKCPWQHTILTLGSKVT